MNEETIGWVGIGLLVAAGLAIVVEGVLMAVWATAIAKRTQAIVERLNTERGLIDSDVEKLRLAMEETRRLWQPYGMILRWLGHPLTIALWQSYRRGNGAVTETQEAASQPSAAAVHQAVEDAVARERARMARELHDTVATDLAGAISLFKVYVEGHPGSAKKGPVDGTLLNVLEIMERMLKQVRETLSDLRPRPIGPEGLVGDIRHQAEDFARLYSIRVEISVNGTEDMLSAQQREVVYQVVREALTNVRRHSGSAICRVRMAFAARPFLIEVADEGSGLKSKRSSGYGLVGMRERAVGIGGRLEVVSTEGRGTTVFLFGPN